MYLSQCRRRSCLKKALLHRRHCHQLMFLLAPLWPPFLGCVVGPIQKNRWVIQLSSCDPEGRSLQAVQVSMYGWVGVKLAAYRSWEKCTYLTVDEYLQCQLIGTRAVLGQSHT
ncbi:hypothetical protein BCR44DRAFT_266087 [Catenaria anguillulae PL171]|uniref:Uncharacterized protein n=1 Tax=Catenaria anguillulae PL171 TaxID=765915 RepID=A0A1Y2HA76_9FUNG|nr:hypothetical protein BCR44DRAFT_266087 [Catenaria anguillulae PL171]